MAHVTHSETRPFLDGIAARIAGGFASLGRALVATAETHSRIEQVKRLDAMSDAELKARGIRRDQIVHHVFRDIYYL